MALEFALRPRLNLDAPAPQRRLHKVRLPRLALPIAAYWLGMAGVTHVLLRLTAEDSAASEVTAAATPHTLEVADEPAPDALPLAGPSLPETAQNAVPTPAPEPDVEPARVPVATPTAASEPAVERAPEPPPREPLVAAAPRAPTAQPKRSEPAFRAEPRAPEARVPTTPVEAPAPRPNEVATAPPNDEPTRGAPVSLPSCESAAASANETMDLGAAAGAPDLSRDAFGSILENGAYLARCALPPRTALEICAAVREGKVVGISVKTEPRNAAIGACVTRAVTALRFPKNARLDVTRTRFEAVR